jgi:Secretion system C-terminal sorting domain
MHSKLLFFVLFFPLICRSQAINTVAGNGTGGFSGDGGPATAAQFGVTPGTYGVAADNAGNFYIVDRGNNRIRKVSSTGNISTFAGCGATTPVVDGIAATAAAMEYPEGIATDNAGNVYFGDPGSATLGHCRVRKVSPAGIITTVAGDGTNGSTGDGGPATAAQLSQPGYLATDKYRNLYICDINTLRVRKVDTNGIITAFAGTGVIGFSGDGGPATAAQFYHNFGVACDTSGNVFISDYHRIRKVDAMGIISTYAGTGVSSYSGDGGPATAAGINAAYGLAVNRYGELFFCDYYDQRIRKIDTAGIITTVAGSGTSGFSGDGGPATAAQLNYPVDICFGVNDKLYIDDYSNGRIRSFPTIPDTPRFASPEYELIAACSGQPDSLNTHLPVIESMAGLGLTWSVSMPPLHGTAYVACAAVSTGGSVTPSGAYYVPASGYTGADSFSVVVSNGSAGDTVMLHFTATNCALAAATEGAALTHAISVFPDPATNELTIGTGTTAFTSFMIVNPIGSIVVEEQITQPQTTVNVRSLSPGPYYIILNGGEGRIIKRFIKY